MPLFWRVAADVMVGLHYTFLAYLIVGGFVAWRWRWTIWTHVATAIWGLLIIVTRVPCPLTALQNNFRERAGQAPVAGGFIAHYVRGVLYPAADERLTQLLVALVVLASWAGFVLRRRRTTRRRTSVPAEPTTRSVA